MKKPEPYVIERDGKFWAVTEFVGPFAEVTEAWRWVDDNTDGGRQDVVWRDQLQLIFGGAAITNIRTERIDAAVSAAGELISALSEKGPINSDQADLLVTASVRAIVPNAEDWEIHDGAVRILKELEDEDKSRNGR